VTHAQVPGPVGVGPLPQKALGVDLAPTLLQVGTGGGLGAGALLAQLGERRLPGCGHQPGLSSRIGGGGIGDGRGLHSAKRASSCSKKALLVDERAPLPFASRPTSSDRS